MMPRNIKQSKGQKVRAFLCKGGCYLHTSMAHKTRVRVRQPLVMWGGTRAGFVQMISLISCWTFTSDSLPEHLTSRPNIKILNYTGSLLLVSKCPKIDPSCLNSKVFEYRNLIKSERKVLKSNFRYMSHL